MDQDLAYTDEPWIAKDAGLFGPSKKPSIGQVLSSGTSEGDILAKSYQRRIVACVNKLAGWSIEAIEDPSTQAHLLKVESKNEY